MGHQLPVRLGEHQKRVRSAEVVDQRGSGRGIWYYPREAAIPRAQVREALEEFCRARSGQRPECIPWLLLDQTV
ncbi:Imm1 family immunity protein [Streptomyces sp. NPDC059165]|uniref:Imm1 family immunity protein n=1 Tax=Streptomyces sp. NPDC059165 TaxID=3346751 RepID=UPI003674B365